VNRTYPLFVLPTATLVWLLACAQEAVHSAEIGAVDELPVVQAEPAEGGEETAGEMTSIFGGLFEDDDALPETDELLPERFAEVWKPWRGDFKGMAERRVLRVLVPFGGYQFYYVRGRPRGAIVELLQRFEEFVNEELGRRHVRVYVVPIPISRDRLLPDLIEGHADLVAADLTTTTARKSEVVFSRPLLRNVNEIVITGPSAPKLSTLEDLSEAEIVVRKSSSYFEHLQDLAVTFTDYEREPPIIIKADELLEAEDLLEMVNAGLIPMTVMDEYKARFWSGVFPELVVRDDLVINAGGSIAWAMRNDTPEFHALVEKFLRKYGKGTLVGNDTFNRYLSSAARVRCANYAESVERHPDLVNLLQKYGEQYDFDWLMLTAQGYQESGLRQNRRSGAGAVGIMQIKPSTAADRNVGVLDVENLENNIHAGAKYMRFIADRYFDGMNPLDQWLFSLAAYNAGPARVAKLRNEAEQQGYDRNSWFDDVEIIAAKRIGRETVTYVSNIYKYYVGYRLAAARVLERRERYGTELTGCVVADVP
jgi:membrane-bound lytic murein transglycosylase MltF